MTRPDRPLENAERANDDCFRTSDPRLRHDAALALLNARVTSLSRTETVAVSRAHGRVLAADLVAAGDVPAHTNSAVDGYAFAYRASADPLELAVVARATAGHPAALSVEGLAHTCAVRIFTGAALPPGADTVAMQEDCRTDPASGTVSIPPGLKRGANVRRAGEDVLSGTCVLKRGARLRPQDLAALSSLGISEIAVGARPRIALVATGDEVRSPGSGSLAYGQVYDANTAMLSALLEAAGGEVADLGIWSDDRAEVRARLLDAATRFDLVVTSGGASLGEEDHMAASLAEVGSRHFWQIAVKPGRPLLFGQVASGPAKTTLVVGLPGNPVAVFVCAALYVRPLVLRLQGASTTEPRRFRLPAAFEFKGRKRGRREFWRGMLVSRPAGPAVDKFRRDGSGLVSGLLAADGLIDIPEEHGDVAHGDPVDFIPMTELGIGR